MRQILCHLPDGSYTFSDFLDDDGIDNHPIELCVKITIDGTEAIIDFTGSADQVKGSMNATYAITVSAVFYVFQCLACGDIPSNSGCLDPIEIIAPAGSIVNAQFPAAVAGGNVETSQRIVDVLLGALAKACPDRIPAASSGTMNNLTIGNQNYTYYETIGGGMGANPNRDGISAIQTHMTNTLNTPIESIETSYPLQVEKYRIRSNSGGAGRFRGGDGIVRSFRLLLPAQVTILSERRKFAPYGLDGGESGETGRNTLKRNNQDIELDGKVSFTGDNEDVIEIRTPGGGGFGALK
jgi:N-methylhydantoinase B